MNPPVHDETAAPRDGTAHDGQHGLAGPLAVSLLLALVVSAPVTLAVLRGGAEAGTAVLAFGVTLAAVWILGALGAWALQAIDGPNPRLPRPRPAEPVAGSTPDSPLGTNR
jgi:hypothetical protein